MRDTDRPCLCGHVYDEHASGGRECTIDECRCVAFEADWEEHPD